MLRRTIVKMTHYLSRVGYEIIALWRALLGGHGGRVRCLRGLGRDAPIGLSAHDRHTRSEEPCSQEGRCRAIAKSPRSVLAPFSNKTGTSMPAMFSQRKAAQVAAFFANAEQQPIHIIKLVKLIYLADREFMRRHGRPILYDDFYSMDHGPVNSTTYNLIKGEVQEAGDWEEWVSSRKNHRFMAKRDTSREKLDELSDAEFDVLRAVWGEFGKLNEWELRDFTHDHCPEWRDPNGSSIPIDYDDVLRAVGFNDKQVDAIRDEINTDGRIARLFRRIA